MERFVPVLFVLLMGFVGGACGETGQVILSGDWARIADGGDLGRGEVGRSGRPDAADGEVSPGPDLSVAEAAASVDSGDGGPLELASPEAVAEAVAETAGELPAGPCAGDSECQDGDPCTEDRCQEGGCSHLPLPLGLCCLGDGDCNDQVACTKDKCVQGLCQHYQSDNNCCAVAADCPDQDPCTVDLCLANNCAHLFFAGYGCACADFLDCDDGLACTYEWCEGGVCKFGKNPEASGCCSQDSDCSGGAVCIQHLCAKPAAPPCLSDSHCDDGDPCTGDSCTGGKCLFAPIGGCCQVNGQCDDGVAATVDLCLANKCVNALAYPPTACADSQECVGGNACLQADCLGGHCSYQVVEAAACCASEGACDDGNPCTVDLCSSFQCQHQPAAGPVVQQSWSFDNGSLAGFEVVSDGSTVTWQLSGKKFISAPGALYFGDLGTATISNGKTVKGTVATPPVKLGSGGALLFRAWTYIHCEPIYTRDLVSISMKKGEQSVEIWNKEKVGGTTAYQWKEIEVDLGAFAGFAGQEVRFLFSFDSVDGKNNAYEGVYYDDIRLLWPCAGQ